MATRRDILTGMASMTALMAGGAVTTRAEAQITDDMSVLRDAAEAFLGSLGPEARQQATFAFEGEERTRWHWTIVQTVPRNGLAMSDMTDDQRDLAFALLRAGSSEAGYLKCRQIMDLQAEAQLQADPLFYFVTIFGDPAAQAPWGWRFEGHHLSRHFTVADGQISMTPFFMGAWPSTTPSGLRAMSREEDAAREIMATLPADARAQALFNEQSLTDHVTQNAVQVAPLPPVGLRCGDMPTAQQALVDEILVTYLGNLPTAVANRSLAKIDAASRGEMRFGWAGGVDVGQAHYYRIQGPTFLLEYDCSRNGATHIHSVWRDFNDDFGARIG